MKIYEIKDLLKKELLIVEISKQIILTKTSTGYMLRDNSNNEDYFIEGYTLLGKPDEIKESDAKELVEQSIHTGLFAHYVKDIPVNTYCYKTAIESFNSALESEIYWDVNPFKKPDNYNLWVKYGDLSQYGVRLTTDNSRWHEAQEKTFDRNRTLIFVKI